MLEHHRFSNLSRRWRWAIVVLAAVLTPMQLVARSPEPPSKLEAPAPTTFAIITDTRASITWQNEQKRADERAEPEEVEFRIQVEKLKIDKAKEEIDRKLKEKEKEIQLAIEGEQVANGEIKLKIAKLIEQAAQERESGQEPAKKSEIQAFEELRRLLEQARAVRSGADVQAEREKLRDVILAQLEEAKRAIDRATAGKDKTEFFLADRAAAREQDDVAQEIRRLEVQLERLAIEQRQLAEEIRRLQSQPPRK